MDIQENANMNRERRIGLVLFVTIIFIALAATAIVVTRESRALYYTVIFKDAKGLQPGDRVQMNGVNIGVVKWVQLNTQPTQIHVRLKIDPQYAQQVRMNSTAVIRDVSFPNVSGQRVVDVINPETDTPTPPLPRYAVVRGVNGAVDLQVWKLRKHFNGAGDAMAQAIGVLGETARELGDSMQQIAASPQVRQAVQDLRAFMHEMTVKGRAGLAYLQAQWPKIREELAPVMKELEALGRRHVVDELQHMVRQIEQTLEARKHPEAESATPDAAPTTAP
jgi:ABC-type transporter Mla subunit MlaD